MPLNVVATMLRHVDLALNNTASIQAPDDAHGDAAAFETHL